MKCGWTICTKCKNEYHGKRPCSDAVDIAVQRWAKKRLVQTCSKCNMLVEKTRGCNHMTCPICRYQWCWLCGATYTDIHFSPLNPLGCPGLQGGNHRKQNWSQWKRIGWRILVFLGLIIALPFIILFGFPVAFVFWCYDQCYSVRRMNVCPKIPVTIFLFIIGMVLNPIAVALALIGLPFAIMYFIGNYICQRLKMRREYKRNIRIKKQKANKLM